MELALSLGDTPKPFTFLDKSTTTQKINNKDLGFCMGLGPLINGRSTSSSSQEREVSHEGESDRREKVIRDEDHDQRRSGSSSDPTVQLDLLLPFSLVPRHHQSSSKLSFPWLTQNLISEPGLLNGPGRGLDVNRLPAEEQVEDRAAPSSPNSDGSSFQMDFPIYISGGRGKRDLETSLNNDFENDRNGSSRASDEDENGLTRKKLRLSKDQSAFLEESFKEHNTLNPKQKLALAKQLNLRPRQVEVWFQNRRARTKLKQTEVDCEYLKRCCETLTEENRRLQKELHELRALKTSKPFYMQLPATTLTMCPSCERVATTSTSTTTTTATAAAAKSSTSAASLAKPTTLYPFSQAAT